MKILMPVHPPLTSSPLAKIAGSVIAAAVFMYGCAPVDPIEPVTYDAELDPLLQDEPADGTCTKNVLRQPYFGDTHVHTNYSFDAESQDVRMKPEDAYAFARGATIGVPPYLPDGTPSRTTTIDRPLDFAMVSDHAEFLGDHALCYNPASEVYNTIGCNTWRGQDPIQRITFFGINLADKQDAVNAHNICNGNEGLCFDHSITLWQREQIAAHEAYDPCNFTAFVGYEWTGAPQTDYSPYESQNLHRNVMFANAYVPDRPTSYFQTPHEEDLWDRLTVECLNKPQAAGSSENCNVLTIPHNSNVGFGLMFEQQDKFGNPIDASYAAKRAQFEPIIELYQHKGNSECHFSVGSSDEECGFEYMDYQFLGANGSNRDLIDSVLGPRGNGLYWMRPFDEAPAPANAFVRDALKEGLKMQNTLSENAFKYGMIGSTDTHLAAPGQVTEGPDYPGHGGAASFDLNQQTVSLDKFFDDVEHSPGGLAVVWAEENTRTGIFNAMQRKEVYATSGPRHILRFFGGWDYDAANLCSDANMIATADAGGVPMGGDLTSIPAPSSTPKFLISALKDSQGLDLDRVQIIKGWVDGNGDAHEQVVDVTPAGNASVDTATCAPIGSGASNLCAVWEDANFDPSQQAFYYARVIENPSCRWTQQACNTATNAGVLECGNPALIPEGLTSCCDGSIPAIITERSWSSPIWFNPNAQ